MTRLLFSGLSTCFLLVMSSGEPGCGLAALSQNAPRQRPAGEKKAIGDPWRKFPSPLLTSL